MTAKSNLILCFMLFLSFSAAKFLHQQKFTPPKWYCPEDYPNWNGESCVQCETTQFWDEGLKACHE